MVGLKKEYPEEYIKLLNGEVWFASPFLSESVKLAKKHFVDGSEEALDAALVEDCLLESRDVGDGVRDAVRALDAAVAVGVPETDFEHVVGFYPLFFTRN